MIKLIGIIFCPFGAKWHQIVRVLFVLCRIVLLIVGFAEIIDIFAYTSLAVGGGWIYLNLKQI